MERRPITRFGGATLFGVLALIWGWLAKGDEALSVFGLLTSSGAQSLFGFIGDWGWVALLALAVATLVWGDPLHWPVALTRPRESRYMSLAEAATYIATKSAWARQCPEDMKDWNRALPREIADAVSLGRVKATGRRPRQNYNRYDASEAGARAAINAATWETSWFQAIPNVIPTESETSNVIWDRTQTNEPAFIDVALDRKDVRREWAPLWFWDHFESPIARQRAEMSKEKASNG